MLHKLLRSRLAPSSRTYIMSHLLLLTIGFAVCLTPWATPDSISGSIVLAVGGSLIAVGVAGHALYLHVMWSQKEEGRLEEIRRAGIACVFGKRSIAMRSEYDIRLERASKSIDILGFGLKHLREDHLRNFSAWANRAHVRILVIDPEAPSVSAPYASQRDCEEGNEIGQIAQDVRTLVNSCRDLINAPSGQFRMRLYTCLPSVNIFRIDSEIFWGPYFVGDVSRNMPTFLLDDRGYVAEAVMGHFEQIWNNPSLSRGVPRDWLERDE